MLNDDFVSKGLNVSRKPCSHAPVERLHIHSSVSWTAHSAVATAPAYSESIAAPGVNLGTVTFLSS